VVAGTLMKTLAMTPQLSPSKAKSRWQTGEKSAVFFKKVIYKHHTECYT